MSAPGGVPSNPFDDPDALFLVVVNDEQQHSLWPDGLPVPDGWSVAHPADTRDGALAYVEQHWTDLRPLTVRRRHAEQAGAA